MEKQSQYGNKKSENKKKKRVGRIILNVIFYLIMVIFIAVLIFSLVEKISGKDIYPFFGYRGMIVESGSMSFKNEDHKEFLEGHDEQFKINDFVFTRRLKDGEEPDVYDIVTFKLGNETVIHRVVEIKFDSVTGEKLYVTRGDAAPDNDSPKKIEDITGIYCFSMGQFGVVVKFFKSSYGIIALIACLTIIAITSLILNYLKKKPENDSAKTANKKQNESQKEPDQSNTVSLSEAEESRHIVIPTNTNVIETNTNVIPSHNVILSEAKRSRKDLNPNIIPSEVEESNQIVISTNTNVIPSEVEESNPPCHSEPVEESNQIVISTEVEKSHPCNDNAMEKSNNDEESE